MTDATKTQGGLGSEPSEVGGVPPQTDAPVHSGRPYTSKQMGDACEMLVAGEMTLRGVPATKMPDNWPHYDVIAQPPSGGQAQRISVKSRTYKRGGDTFVVYKCTDQFDWLAIVLLPGDHQLDRQIFIIPRAIADQKSRRDKPTSKTAGERYWRQDEVAKIFPKYKNNFALSPTGLDGEFPLAEVLP